MPVTLFESMPVTLFESMPVTLFESLPVTLFESICSMSVWQMIDNRISEVSDTVKDKDIVNSFVRSRSSGTSLRTQYPMMVLGPEESGSGSRSVSGFGDSLQTLYPRPAF